MRSLTRWRASQGIKDTAGMPTVTSHYGFHMVGLCACKTLLRRASPRSRAVPGAGVVARAAGHERPDGRLHAPWERDARIRPAPACAVHAPSVPPRCAGHAVGDCAGDHHACCERHRLAADAPCGRVACGQVLVPVDARHAWPWAVCLLGAQVTVASSTCWVTCSHCELSFSPRKEERQRGFAAVCPQRCRVSPALAQPRSEEVDSELGVLALCCARRNLGRAVVHVCPSRICSGRPCIMSYVCWQCMLCASPLSHLCSAWALWRLGGNNILPAMKQRSPRRTAVGEATKLRLGNGEHMGPESSRRALSLVESARRLMLT